MKNRALFSILAVAFVLAACEGNPLRIFGGGPTPTKVCDKNGTCQVNVTVTGCADGGSQIRLDHEVVGMKRGDSNIKIHWQLANSPGYEFPQQAIRFASGEFGAPTGNKNNYFFDDRNSPGSGTSPHKYTVTVVKTGGAVCATKDPFIINDYVDH